MNHPSGDESSSCYGPESERTAVRPDAAGADARLRRDRAAVPPQRRRTGGATAVMRVHVDEQRHIDDLLIFLPKVGGIALGVDDCTLEIHLPETTSEHAERLELSI